MHAFALIILLIAPNGGGEAMAMSFPTEEACLVAQAALPKRIGAHNAKAEGQISKYASACVPIKKAPAGTSV